MRINLVTVLLVITVTIALLLLVPLSATSQPIASNIVVSNEDAKFNLPMRTNPGLDAAIRAVDRHPLTQGASAVLDRSLKALPSEVSEKHPKVVSATGADSVRNVSLDISQLQARPAIGPNTRIQVQGADDVQSLSLANPFVDEVTSTQLPTETPMPVQTSAPVPAPAETPLPIQTDIPPVPTDTPLPLPSNTPMPTQTDTPSLPTNTPLPPPTETPMPTGADRPLPESEPTRQPTHTPGPTNGSSENTAWIQGFFTVIAAIISGIIGPLILYKLYSRNQATNFQGPRSGGVGGEDES